MGITISAAFVNFSASDILKDHMYLLNLFNHVHIWQKSTLPSCGDTCQIWTWYSNDNQFSIILSKWNNIWKEEIVIPHPRSLWPSDATRRHRSWSTPAQVAEGTKSLLEPMFADNQRGLVVFTLEQFHSKRSKYIALIWFWKWLFQDYSPISQKPMS